MNIGFVSTWFERGASYVTRSYIDLLKPKHNIFVYARGGEIRKNEGGEWDKSYVTWGLNLRNDYINYRHFKKWIKSNDIDIVFFNEQKNTAILYKIKRDFPNLKLGSYIDYYKEDTVSDFNIYDFLICNTKRHYSVFKNHIQAYYVPWGTDVELFNVKERSNPELVFYHSAGMSVRKGTEFVIDAFIKGKIYKHAKLILHSQISIEKNFNYKKDYLEQYNIEVIEETVPAPGLYHLADVYVYPTKLDGLGLTMYESLASGLPVITTDYPPMNEVINNEVGYLVKVDYLRTRKDAYYWPLSIVKEESLIEAMNYYISNRNKIGKFKNIARERAVELWDWKDRKEEINYIFEHSKVVVDNSDEKLTPNYTTFNKLINEIGSSYFYFLYKELLKK